MTTNIKLEIGKIYLIKIKQTQEIKSIFVENINNDFIWFISDTKEVVQWSITNFNNFAELVESEYNNGWYQTIKRAHELEFGLGSYNFADLSTKEKLELLEHMVEIQQFLYSIYTNPNFAHYDVDHKITNLIKIQTLDYYVIAINEVIKWMKEEDKELENE